MADIKSIVGIAAIALTFIGYVSYIRDVIKGKTHPHAYSWFLWATVSAIIFCLQLTGGGGIGAFVTLAAVLVTYLIFGLGLRYGKQDITRSDTIFLVLAVLAGVLWLVAEQATLSVVLLTIVEVLAFAPTIRKTWNKPHTETLSSYALNTVRFGMALVALQQYNLLTALYPVVWLVCNGLFCMLLLVRRKQVQPAA